MWGYSSTGLERRIVYPNVAGSNPVIPAYSLTKLSKMAKIAFAVYKTGGLDCCSKTCAFKSTCANHYTAGDFRSEGGLTPKLRLVGKTFECDTYIEGGPIDFHEIPLNIEANNDGALYLENGEFKLVEYWRL